MSLTYTPLHVHTSRGSLLDSINTPETLVGKAKESGIHSIAITDHGNCSTHLEFYKACTDNDIKPVLGMEGYITDDMYVKDKTSTYYHIILLAKNKVGYKNLLKMTSLAHVEGFYRKPRLDLKTIQQKDLGKGIIASSACLGGEIPQLILKDTETDQIKETIQSYVDTFEELYLEMQGTSFDEDEQSNTQIKVNETIYKLSQEMNVPLIVTSDAHFTDKEDYNAHNVFIQISQNRDNEVYKDCWLKTSDEMLTQNYGNIPQNVIEQAMKNTESIADKCNVELSIGVGQVPTANVPDNISLEEYFLNMVIVGCKKKGFDTFSHDKKELYWDRIKKEYHIMKAKGFIHYFLLLKEIIEEAKKRDIIISPSARGSAASSLICYVLGITHVDPIKYNLIFERFLTIEKKGLPD